MLIPAQALPSVFMETGGATFVPTTRVRPGENFSPAAQVLTATTIAMARGTVHLPPKVMDLPP
jgi:hypothetical protein